MKRIPLYPLGLAAFPVVSIFAANAGPIPYTELWRPLGISVALGAAVLLLSAVLFRHFGKAALFTLLLLCAFFTFGPLSSAIGRLEASVADWLLIGLGLVLIWTSRKDFAGPTRFLNVCAVLLLVIPVVQALMKTPPTGTTYLRTELPVSAGRPSSAITPDIFFIIVDGYGRADEIERVMGYDNSSFVKELRRRGFFVADRSHSNYCQTQLSLAATLNLTFLQDHRQAFPASSEDRRPLAEAISNSFVSTYLRRLGYTYIGVTSGFPEVEFPAADVSYSTKMPVSMLETAVLELTPISIDRWRLVDIHSRRRALMNAAFDNLEYLRNPAARPRFIAAHLLAPHPPFEFGPNGEPRAVHMPFGFWDGSHYMAYGGTPTDYAQGYVSQLQYLNMRLLGIVDALQAGGSVKPVIIIEGDHGSKLRLDQESADKTDLNECFGNLIAIFGPDSVTKQLYPSMTSVNTFGAVFRGLFGADLPKFPDRSYYSPWSKPYRFTEITDKLTP